MTYTPNWANARVRARTIRAIEFCQQYLRPKASRWVARDELYRHLGNTSRPLGRYLKEHLVIVSDSWYNMNTGVCMKYIRNTEGISQIRQALGIEAVTLTALQEQQLDTGDFVYTHKENRQFNQLQYIPKQARGSILANKGYRYHYDIEAAAPTLLLQLARRENPHVSLPHLQAYTENRTQLRNQISQETQLSTAEVKQVINAVLLGGRVSAWHANKIFQQLNSSYAAIAQLKASPTFTAIKQDISIMWRVIKRSLPTESQTERITARVKSKIYFELENQVGEQIRRLLKKQKIRALWMHDGWACDTMIDPQQVEDHVRQLTGFRITLAWDLYADI